MNVKQAKDLVSVHDYDMEIGLTVADVLRALAMQCNTEESLRVHGTSHLRIVVGSDFADVEGETFDEFAARLIQLRNAKRG